MNKLLFGEPNISSYELLKSELMKIKEELHKSSNMLSYSDKKHFWKIVGQIKRQTNPSLEIIEIASEIREELYQKRLGVPKSVIPVLFIFTICGIGFLLCSITFAFEEFYPITIILSLILLVLFMVTYIWIIQVGKTKSAIIFIIVVGLTLVYDILMINPKFQFLNELNKYYAIIAVPAFYLWGRLVGGYIGKIQFDGVSRDVFYLPTMKINYKSYLTAPAPSRQWIFLFGGLGTVFTFLLVSSVVFLVYNDPFLYIFPILLFLGELLDYMNLAGPLGGAEFNHLRREHKIIRDWKKNFQKVSQ